MNRKLAAALVLSAATAFPAAAHASADIFLRIDGIAGESKDPRHKNEIEILSWSLGANQVAAPGNSGAARGGRSCLSDFHVVKVVDRSSPMLLMATMTGHHIPQAVLTVRKTGGQGSEPYLVVKLDNVLISSYQTSGNGDVPADSVSLSFAAAEFTYYVQLDDGRRGEPVSTRVSGNRC